MQITMMDSHGSIGRIHNYNKFSEQHARAENVVRALSRPIFLDDLTANDVASLNSQVVKTASSLYGRPAGRGRSMQELIAQAWRGLAGQLLIRKTLLSAGCVETPCAPDVNTFVDLIFDGLYLEVKLQSVRNTYVSFSRLQQLDTINENLHRLDYLITFKLYDDAALNYASWPPNHPFIVPWWFIHLKTFTSTMFLKDGKYSREARYYDVETGRLHGEARMLNFEPVGLEASVFKNYRLDVL